jgi:protein required for attachment to host cells
MLKDGKLCIVIADGGHARFVHPAPDNALHTIEAMDSADLHKKDQDLVSDRPGRSFESASAARHAYTPRHDPHDMAKQRFAQAVAERINENAAAGRFDGLVIAAPSQVLNELLGALDGTTRAKLLGTLRKDLVKTPDHELRSHLTEWVRPVQRA